jgi:hypothetical protein
MIRNRFDFAPRGYHWGDMLRNMNKSTPFLNKSTPFLTVFGWISDEMSGFLAVFKTNFVRLLNRFLGGYAPNFATITLLIKIVLQLIYSTRKWMLLKIYR